MPFWDPRSWPARRKRTTLDAAEYVGVVAAGSVGSLNWGGLFDADMKPLAVASSIAFTFLAAGSKFALRRLDDGEKDAAAKEKEAADAARKEAEDKIRAEADQAVQCARQQAKRIVQAILLHMHEHFFEQSANADKLVHRITLFQQVSGASEGGPCKRWLQVYARHGWHQNSATVWPLDEDVPGGCRGVAGRIWLESATLFESAACPWPLDGNPKQKAEYASSHEITVDEAERLNVKSQFFAGTVVLVNGKKWGVLLVDSLKTFEKAKEGGQRGLQRKRIERYATLIGRAIEGAS